MAAVCPLFYCRKTAAVESARLLWRAACPQNSSRGIGGCPPTSGVLFVQKDTACQRVYTLTEILHKIYIRFYMKKIQNDYFSSDKQENSCILIINK